MPEQIKETIDLEKPNSYFDFMKNFDVKVHDQSIKNFRENLYPREQKEFDQLPQDKKEEMVIFDEVLKRHKEEEIITNSQGDLPGFAEIREALRRYLEIYTHSLNNFYCKFPGGFQRMAEFQSPGNQTLKEQLGEEALSSGHSEKRLDQIKGDFFETIDRTTLELGFDLEEIKRQNEEIIRLSQTQSLGLADQISNIRTRLLKKLIPVYIKLIEQGYNNVDLR